MIVYCPQCQKPIGQADPTEVDRVLAQHDTSAHYSPWSLPPTPLEDN